MRRQNKKGDVHKIVLRRQSWENHFFFGNDWVEKKKVDDWMHSI